MATTVSPQHINIQGHILLCTFNNHHIFSSSLHLGKNHCHGIRALLGVEFSVVEHLHLGIHVREGKAVFQV